MQDKLERIPEYIHYMARNAQGRRDAAAVKTRRPLWLVSERSYDAQDNGFVFFQYMTEKHPEIETYYLIGKNDPDYWKVYAVSGRIIEPGSREHYMAMYYASALISTHTFGFTPDMTAYYHLAQKGLFHPKGVNVFLQHGVLDKKTDWLSADHYHPDLMTVSALPEYEYALNGLKQPEPVLMPAGLCRYDNLVHAGHEKPSWYSRRGGNGFPGAARKNSGEAASSGHGAVSFPCRYGRDCLTGGVSWLPCIRKWQNI